MEGAAVVDNLVAGGSLPEVASSGEGMDPVAEGIVVPRGAAPRTRHPGGSMAALADILEAVVVDTASRAEAPTVAAVGNRSLSVLHLI